MKNKKPMSIGKMLGIAALLLAAGLFIHVPTALGQDIAEHLVTGWQGVYQPSDEQSFLEVFYQGDNPVLIPIGNLPQSWFTKKGPHQWETTLDDPRVIRLYASSHLGSLQEMLGTRNNVASLSVIFPAGPVAYTSGLLQAMTRLKLNPDAFGGPNIPPGSVPIHQLTNGLLHIDTAVNNNTLTQCAPSQMPQELRTLLGAKSAKE